MDGSEEVVLPEVVLQDDVLDGGEDELDVLRVYGAQNRKNRN